MAAVTADSVIIALIGDTKGLDGPVNASATQFDRSMSKIEASATRAERAIVKSNAQIGAANRNVARQFQDIAVTAGSGQSFPLIMLQQLPQLADALQDTGSKAAGIAKILSGPYVQAGFAAVAVGVALYQILGRQGNEVDALVEKMRKQARQNDLNRQADNAWRITIEGVTEAIRKRREEQEKSLKTDQQAEQQALATAKGDLADLRALPQGGGLGGVGGETVAVDNQERKIASLQQRIADLRRSIADAEASVRGAEIPIGQREVEGRVDAAVAATNRYTEALGKLNRQRIDGLITQKQYNDQLEIEKKRLKAAQEAASASRRVADADAVPFLRPVRGGATSGSFGENRGRRGHGGIDIAVPVGTSVSAAAAGTIIESGTLPGYGNVVIIDHGRGTTTRYAHLSKLLGAKGDTVGAGDVIGLSGGARGAAGAGNSRGPHLHYEVRRNGRPVDPNGAAFPIDPATARKVKDTIKEDFDKLWDELQRDADQATGKITSDFEALEGAIDPATKLARELESNLDKIEKARLVGIIDDARALELSLKETARASADLLGNAINIEGLRTAAGVERGELDERESKEREAEDRVQARREDHVHELANLYETLFTGGTMNLWDEFKQQGLRALAELAAQETFKAITGNAIGLATGGGGGIFGSILGAIFGRASGGRVGPGSVHRVNEHRGGVELLRMGPQGGEVIPLGQASASRSTGNVTVHQHFTLDARQGITTPQLLQGVNSLVDQKAGMARDQAVAISRGTIPKDMQRQQRYQR
jgi:murein DD-endopeptidase MepM/ murein hydrolase activator NlpD